MIPRNRRTIDLSAIEENMRLIKGTLPAGVRALAVVKADGYGHGAAETARAAIRGGADFLAVATEDEGIQLRKAGLDLPILVLGAVTEGDALCGTENGLIQTVCSPEMVRMCEEAGRKLGKQTEVHLKVDTGMGRIGVRNEAERDATIQALNDAPHVKLTGAFTHFSDADGDEEGVVYTREQFLRFQELIAPLPEGILRHCANSAAIHRMPMYALDMVRAGISLYGYPPVPCDLPLRMCMSWTAKVSYVKEVPAGCFISYGRTYESGEPRRLATITCGYADGYHRRATGKAQVLIRGKRFPVIGRICMDQMMADITGAEEIVPGDEVVLMGQSGDETISAEDLARWSGTISYEILTIAGSRVERVFSGKS